MVYRTKCGLYKYIDKLRECLKIDYNSYPLNCIEICKENNVDLKYHNFNTNGFCAAAFKGKKIDTVVLNSNRDSIEQNFDCGHEIIHLSKHRGTGMDYFNCFEKCKTIQDRFLEWEANEGSAELLVPYKLLLSILKENNDELSSWRGIGNLKKKVSEHFRVSDAVVKYRFESLKYEISQHLQGVNLNDINILSLQKQHEREIRIKSLNEIEMNLFGDELSSHFKKRVC